MGGLETFLEIYGLAAIFAVLLVKSAGVPIPIPGDVIILASAVRAAEGKLSIWQAFLTILLALVLGSVVQFLVVRGVGRSSLYRFGRYVGLTPARLDALAERLQRRGIMSIGLAVFTPGVRAASVAACGLAGLPLRLFVAGLVLGQTAFLFVHFLVGLLGGALLATITAAVPLPWLIVAVASLLAGFGAWVLIRRRQHPGESTGELLEESFESWHAATCPICLAIGAQERRGLDFHGAASHA
jgi:membrane protein DedA with SNARE-associated domain